jgi:tagaturonate reductase
MSQNTIKTPLLNKAFVADHPDVFKLGADVLSLPEKVIQFGTGVLLRGLVDYVIDAANKKQIFNGSVVVVKSTSNVVTEFEQQDNFYTILEKGLHLGGAVEQKYLVTCISRVLSAQNEWESILQCAADPLVEIVISNTTEAGLVFVDEVLSDQSPQSFPAKLTACLWNRYNVFNGDKDKGMVILPTELRSNNGQLLREFVLLHAGNNKLPPAFLDWVANCNHFCNTLVDRIVPGKSEKDDLVLWDDKLSYIDHLHTKAEPFLLWAIEGNNMVKAKLLFAQNDERVIIAEHINGYEEQKLRILNGSNSIVVSPAYLAGCNTLFDTVTDNLFAEYTARLINEEIIPTIIDQCPNAPAFAKEVLDRFGNPFVQYKLLNIALQSSSKMNSRNAATIIKYHHAYGQYPPLTLIGLASFFLFYSPKGKEGGAYYGLRDDVRYPYRDEHTDFICTTLEHINWLDNDMAITAVTKILGNERIFSNELASLPKLASTVAQYCGILQSNGIRETIAHYLNTKS